MKKLLGIVMALVLALAFALPTVAAPPPPSITPATVEAKIFPGGSVTINKTIQTPVIPPSPDIMFLADTTGSMGPALANVQANIGPVMTAVLAAQPTAAFGAAQYKDFPPFSSDPFGYQLDQAVTTNTAAVAAAVGTWVASGGGDTPEAQLNALYTLATVAATGWRPPFTNQNRFIVWFGDNPGHDPSNGHSLAQVVAELTAGTFATIHVLAIPVTTPGNLGLDATGQATAIATATGGAILPAAAPEAVAAAILAALQSINVNVSMATDAVAPLSVSFSPASQNITSGGTVNFIETISVASNAPGGTYTAKDWALINGAPMTDSAGNIIYETKTIKIPEGFLTGGGQISTGNKPADMDISFAGNVGFLADASLAGQWQTNFHNVGVDSLDGAAFHSTSIKALQFFSDNGSGPNPPPANANVAKFTAEGRLNLKGKGAAEDGWKITVLLADRGEPGKGNDSILIILTNPGGTDVYVSTGTDFTSDATANGVPTRTLSSGNLQIHSGVK